MNCFKFTRSECCVCGSSDLSGSVVTSQIPIFQGCLDQNKDSQLVRTKHGLDVMHVVAFNYCMFLTPILSIRPLTRRVPAGYGWNTMKPLPKSFRTSLLPGLLKLGVAQVCWQNRREKLASKHIGQILNQTQNRDLISRAIQLLWDF